MSIEVPNVPSTGAPAATRPIARKIAERPSLTPAIPRMGPTGWCAKMPALVRQPTARVGGMNQPSASNATEGIKRVLKKRPGNVLRMSQVSRYVVFLVEYQLGSRK